VSSVERLVRSARHEDLPVVVSDPDDFLRLSHYASADLAGRFVSMVDTREEVVYVGSDSTDAQLDILRSYSRLHIYDFKTFVTRNPIFLLYSGDGAFGWDWWPRKLERDGYNLQVIASTPISEREPWRRVILVTQPKLIISRPR